MATLEEEVRALTEQIKTLIGKGPSTTTKGMEIAVGFATATNEVVASLSKLATGTYTLSNGLNDMTKVIGGLGGPLGTALGSVVKAISGEMVAMNTVLNQAGKSGANFDNNLGLFSKAVTGARMSMPEFAKMMEEIGPKIAGLAGGAQKGSEAFLAIGKDFAESQTVRQLNAAGVGAEELNKVLQISAVARRGMDMNDQANRMRVSAAAQDMATEMDNVARLTGISRQQQEKQIQDQMKKAEVEIMLAAMDEDQKDAYMKSTTELSKYGKEFQDVLTIYATGGVRNAEDNAKVVAMGPKFAGLLEQMAQIKGTTEADEKQRRAIQSEIDAEALRIAKDPEELRLRAAGTTSMGEFGRAQGEVTRNVLSYAQLLKAAERESIKSGKTVDEELDRMRQENEEKRKAALTSLEPGALINRMEMLMKDISAGVGTGFETVNTKAKELAGGIEALNTNLKPLTAEGVGTVLSNFVKKLNPNPVDQNVANQNPDIAARERERNNPHRQNAFGGDSLPYLPRLVGEFGPEMDLPTGPGRTTASDKTFNLFDEINRTFPTVISGLKSDMKTELAKAKDNMPTVDQIEQAMSRVTASIPKQLPQMPQDNTASNELIAHVKQLNTNVRELITAVVDGSSANVKAVRTSGGNILA